MSFRIDYYIGDQKLGDATGANTRYDAVKTAREGLLLHNARYAMVIDLSQRPERIEIIHRDVLP